MKQVPNPFFEVCQNNKDHPYHNKQCDESCPDRDLCMRGELIDIKEFLGCNDCKYSGIANINGDRHVCLATGDIVLIEELQQCPLDTNPLQKTITPEEVRKYGLLLEEAIEILKRLNDTISRIRYSFDRNDLEALLYGKTKLPKKTIRAVLDAIEKARNADEKHALRKFIATMGDVRYKDVVVVLDEIERLSERYMGDER
ncbi:MULTISPECIES: hypothetical protein [unclassified Archaeoglobus]|jgi:hypothetical protein|uniref:hypothetical protein n=1 Tax=unclassified Archaeoglobus TaxID=2643606 RepID=UPI0025C46B5F|nr:MULTISPECIES: hypothetical protein [unclassified Archaeoglobus]